MAKKSKKKEKDEAEKLYHELLELQRKDIQTPAPATGRGASSAPNPNAQRIVALTHDLGRLAANLIGGGAGEASSQPQFGSMRNGYGTGVTVETLTSKIPPGSKPSVSGDHWEALNHRRDGGSSYYVRGHLLNHNLGGVGHSWANLTPLTQGANNRAQDSMLHLFEADVKDAVAAGGVARDVSIEVTSFQSARRTHLKEIDDEVSKASDPQTGRARRETGDRMTTFSLARLQKIRGIVEQEQYIPRQLICSAKVSDSAGTRVKPKGKVTIDNKIEATDWTRYEV